MSHGCVNLSAGTPNGQLPDIRHSKPDHSVADRSISLPEFQDWLVGATWDVEQHADPDATDLTYSSKLALAELSRGDISHAAFRERMRDLVGTIVPAR